MLVIGFNGLEGTFHDSSASLFVDGRLVFSAEEERFNRVKHSGGIPVRAVEACLSHVGAGIKDVDAFGYFLDLDALYKKYFLRTVTRYWPHSFKAYRDHRFFESLRTGFETEWRRRLGVAETTPLYLFNHHLCHAAAAYHFSCFDGPASALVIDGSGEDETATLFLAEPSGLIRKKATFSEYPKSLGFFYAATADYIGLGWVEGPGKMMGLAPYGKPRYYDALSRVVMPSGYYDIDMAYFTYHLNDLSRVSGRYRRIFGMAPRSKDEPLTEDHADVAASAQAVLEDAILDICRSARELLPLPDLCYSGGVALNIDANSRIHESGLFERIAVHPAAYDGGTSIGAGYLAQLKRFGVRPEPSDEIFLGSAMSTEGLQRVCAEKSFRVTERSEGMLYESAASRLARGEIIGWVQGRMEIGPRALLNRSILAHPNTSRETVNRIKRREGFRPFAPVVLRERLREWFEGGPDESPHMLFKYMVKPEMASRIVGVVHVDGSARAQTIGNEHRVRMSRKLLEVFAEKTRIPILLNTSFNLRGEPLVNTCQQALAALERTELAAVYIGRFEVSKA